MTLIKKRDGQGAPNDLLIKIIKKRDGHGATNELLDV